MLSEIGAGGMGVVYRARDGLMHREVALKLLRHQFDAGHSFNERFSREARIVGRLEHPHIVPLYDVGEHDGRAYLVMRLLLGGTLRQRMQREDFGLSGLMTAMEQIAAALDVAHANHIVHRDLKPSNIMFDEAGSAFLTDFGIAKVIDEALQLTAQSGIIGTPAYMSPEQFSGEWPTEGFSDQYSLAVVLFEALAGVLPFQGSNSAQVMYKHLAVPPPALHEANSAYSPETTAVLERALAKEPSQRYSTVSAFIIDLEQTLKGSIGVLPAAQAETPVRPTPPQAVASPTVIDWAAKAKLADDYQQGLDALNHQDWPLAVAAFERVIEVDRYYRSALKLQREAERRMSHVRTPNPTPGLLPATSPDSTVAPADMGAPSLPPKPRPDISDETARALPIAVTAPEPSTQAGRSRRGPSRRALFWGAVALLLVAALILLALTRMEGAASSATPIAARESSSTKTLPFEQRAAEPGMLLILYAGDGAEAQPASAGVFAPMAADDSLELSPGLTVRSGDAPLAIGLPDETTIILSAGSELEVVEVNADGSSPSPGLMLHVGSLLLSREEVAGELWPLVSPAFARLEVSQGLAAAAYDPQTGRFSAHCFAGECRLGSSGGEVVLSAGESSRVDENGPPEQPASADAALFCQLAPALLPCPAAEPVPPTIRASATPTSAATATPTGTPTSLGAATPTATPAPTSLATSVTGTPPTNTPTTQPSTTTPIPQPSTNTPTPQPSTNTPTPQPSTNTPTPRPATLTPTPPLPTDTPTPPLPTDTPTPPLPTNTPTP